MEKATREQVLAGAAAFRAKLEDAIHDAAKEEIRKEEERQRKLNEPALPADEAERRRQAEKSGMTLEEYEAKTAAEEAAAAELTPEQKADRLIKKLEGNLAIIEPVRRLLSVCDSKPQEGVALLKSVESDLKKDQALPIQPLSALIDMLVRYEALTESLTVNGSPYEGTLEDAFNDEALLETDDVLVFEQVTDIGRVVAERLVPKNRVDELFHTRPELAVPLRRTLELCDCEAGLKTKELEALLDDEGLLFRDEATNIPAIYPSLYGNLLLDAGGIRWDHAWVTTDIGRDCARAHAMTD